MKPRRQRFADLVLDGRPASRAYREAGYSPRSDRCAEVEGSKLLRNPEIVAYLAERRAAAAERAEITLAQVLRELRAIGLDPKMPPQARVSALAEVARRLPAQDGALPVRIEIDRPLTGDDEQDAALISMAVLKAVVAGRLAPQVGRMIAQQASTVMDVVGLARLLREAATPKSAVVMPLAEQTEPRPLSHPKRPVWLEARAMEGAA